MPTQEITCKHQTWLVQPFDKIITNKDEIPSKGLVSDHQCNTLHVYRTHKALKRIYYTKVQEVTSNEVGEVSGSSSESNIEPTVPNVDNGTEVRGGVCGSSEIEVESVRKDD